MTDTAALLARRDRPSAPARRCSTTPAAHRPRRGRLPVRCRRPPLCRHVQQRALRRSRQPARGRGDGAPAGDAQRPQPLPARGHRRLRRAPGRACTGRRSRASSSAAAAPRPTRSRCAWRASPPASAASSAPTPPITATALRRHADPPRRHQLRRTRRVRAFPFPQKLPAARARRSPRPSCATPIWTTLAAAIADLAGGRRRRRRADRLLDLRQ